MSSKIRSSLVISPRIMARVTGCISAIEVESTRQHLSPAPHHAAADTHVKAPAKGAPPREQRRGIEDRRSQGSARSRTLPESDGVSDRSRVHFGKQAARLADAARHGRRGGWRPAQAETTSDTVA